MKIWFRAAGVASALLLAPPAMLTSGAMLAPAVVRADPAPPTGPDSVNAAEGGIPPGAPLTPYDVGHPAIAQLDPELRQAIQVAADQAAAAGVDLRITSGWRSRALQQRLLDDAVARYGSVDVARRWVSLPEVSRHVTGHAVDVGPPAAAHWVGNHGARFGLCEVYANEVWHFELTADGFGNCPPLLADAAAEPYLPTG